MSNNNTDDEVLYRHGDYMVTDIGWTHHQLRKGMVYTIWVTPETFESFMETDPSHEEFAEWADQKKREMAD